MLIGLDASTVATGFAFGGPEDDRPRGGTWKLPGADEQVFDRTLALLAESLHGLIGMVKAKHVAIEAPMDTIDRRHSAESAMALMQVTGALRAVSHRAGCKVHLYSVFNVRKHFINDPYLPGDEAKAAVQMRCGELGWAFLDPDHADANAVWSTGMTRCYPGWASRNTPLFQAGRASA